MIRLTILGGSLFLLVACKSGDEAPASADKASSGTEQVSPKGATKVVASASGLFDKDAVKDPCTLLKAEMVATVAKVPATEVTQRKISTMCLYEWQGGNAGLSFVRVLDTVEAAQKRFERAHEDMDVEEVKAAMEELGAGAKMRIAAGTEEGKKMPTGKSVDVITNGAVKSMGSGIKFEAVEGLGDMAAYETTRHETIVANTKIVSYANKMDVLTGNLSFSISYSLNAADHQGTMHKEEAVALSKLVLDGLK